MRIIVTLACSECKRRNYTTTKSLSKKFPSSFLDSDL
ncbi:MAG: 50S ribosomal protein L33, partial [Deltaproteobacteria bacterium]|nr:50S ribosomal protein L33 [Deltaproteobacteria bacterium]